MAAIALVTAACGLLPRTAAPSRSELEAAARLMLPVDVTVWQARIERGQDTRVLARFDLAAGDLDAFLKACGYRASAQAGLNPLSQFESRTSPAWWQPQTAKVFSGLEQSEPGFTRRVLVDQTMPGRVTVYLEHFST